MARGWVAPDNSPYGRAAAAVTELMANDAGQQLATLYNNFLKNRQKIVRKINSFIKKHEINTITTVHCAKHRYTLTHTNIDFFTEGHKLINEIRQLLGLEPVIYRIGVYDAINGTLTQLDLQEDEFNKYMRTRGESKSALTHELGTIQQMIDEFGKSNKNVDAIFNDFISILEAKVALYHQVLNYGYAFETFGSINFTSSSIKENRHDTYYNYYKNRRHNNTPWTTGGDIGNLQYKLIRIYQDDSGIQQISSASVTSANTIIATLDHLKYLFESSSNNTLTPGEISYELAKRFTQIGIPKRASKAFKAILDEELHKILLNIK